jgi:hypothetical protein
MQSTKDAPRYSTQVKHRPSKTDPYNTAMIFSHVLTLVSMITTIVRGGNRLSNTQ